MGEEGIWDKVERGDSYYVENIEIIEYNMDRIKKFWYDKYEKKIRELKYLLMLDLESEELKELAKGDMFVEAFLEEISELNEHEIFTGRY